jgi:FlaA1/EpsC-like NDP-sugar epimerase
MELESILKDSTILITGSCNELIIELCQQILRYSPKQIVIIDRYESQLNELVSRLRNMVKPNIIKPILCGTISNRKISDVFREFQPEITFHTSTRKYRPAFEIPIEDVLRSNYISTFEIAKYASKFNCKYFVMLSSLEVSKHQSPVFDSLRAAEISLQQFFSTQNTKLAIIRLCDIVENRGSIVSLFKSQIENLEPISIPNPNSSCSILSKYSAVRFIMQNLLKLKFCNTNTILNSAPGIPILLVEPAKKIMTLNGLTIDSDITIDFYQDSYENETNASFLTEDQLYQTNIDIDTNQSSSDNNAFISNEISDAINYLLNMQESDLEYSAWKDYTNKVLSMNKQ